MKPGLVVALFPLLALGRTEVAVRLYWLQQLPDVRVAPRPGGARLRPCANCAVKPVTEAIAFRAVGSFSYAQVAGEFSLEVPGSQPVTGTGPLEIQRQGNHLLLKLRMPIEEYVAAVLAGESSVFRSEESLKAMAVAARTYAVRHRGRHRREGFDLCDTTHCQDLRLSARSDRMWAAAESTEGEMLWYQGSPAATYYHQHCGGTTEASGEVWPDVRAPYLSQKADTFCFSSGRGEWRSRVQKLDLRRALVLAGVTLPSQAGALTVVRRSPSGRVQELRVAGRVIGASAFHFSVGRALGWEILRSGFYEVMDAGQHWIFQGYGAGHGVGLCQVGAAQRGEAGHSYRQILDFYFPGTTLGVSAQGLTWRAMAGERVEVFSTRPHEDQFLVAVADRLLDQAERRVGFALAFRPGLKVYPTVAAFRDATGQAGWIAGSTAGRTVRLQPLPALRSAGRLESTVFHELVHLVVESRANPRLPLWFREGLALYLADPSRAAGSTHLVSEAALSDPRSITEMRRAYEAARSRVRVLVDEDGLDAVIGWLEQGLPPDLPLRFRAQPADQSR